MSNIGNTYPLKDVIHKDPDTGAVVHRFAHDKPSQEQIFYYCSPAITADGRFIPCWSNVSGSWQIHAIDRAKEMSIQLSDMDAFPLGSAFPSDSPCLSRDYGRVYYHDGKRLYWTRIDGADYGWLMDVPEGFCFLSFSARGRYLALSYTERFPLPKLPEGKTMQYSPVLYYRPLSIIVAIDLETGNGEYVWGDHAYLGHVEMCPFDENMIMFVDQSATNRQQEVYVVDRVFTDDKQAFKVLAGNFKDYRGRTQDYIGHCFFTQDGFIAGQYVEMGGLDMRNHYTDRSEFNIVVKPDGTRKRKTKFPGHKKPCHVHCQKSEGLWVGDHWIREDGTVEQGWLSIIRNDFTTQELKSAPLIKTNHYWWRPWHVHPWLGDNEDIVICSYNTGAQNGDSFKGSADDNHMALIEIPSKLRSVGRA